MSAGPAATTASTATATTAATTNAAAANAAVDPKLEAARKKLGLSKLHWQMPAFTVAALGAYLWCACPHCPASPAPALKPAPLLQVCLLRGAAERGVSRDKEPRPRQPAQPRAAPGGRRQVASRRPAVDDGWEHPETTSFRVRDTGATVRIFGQAIV